MTRPYTWQKVVLLAVIAAVGLLVVGAVASIPAAAQDSGNETATPTPTPGEESETVNETPDRVAFELEDVDIRSVEFDNGTVVIHAHYHERASVAVTDSGTVKGLGDNARARVPFEVYTRSEGAHVLKMDLGTEDELVTIQQGGEMRAASGDRNVLTVIQNAPNITLIRWGVISGGIGATVALALIVGALRRRHQNTYKELLSQERVKVNEDPVEGVLGKLKRFVVENKYALLISASITAYLTAVVAGVVPGPVEIWSDATDSQRVVGIGSLIATILFTPVIYPLAIRLWDPSKEYIVSFDVTDALSVSSGSEGGVEEFIDDLREDDGEIDVEEIVNGDDQVALSVYSGAPERVSGLEVVEGEPAEVRTPGGRTQLTRDFDPKANQAEGTWPGTAHDAVIAMKNSAISWNREVLEDESDAFRTLMGGVGAMRSASNSSAAVALNKELAESTDIDPGPMDDILNRALSSTRYAGYFSPGGSDDEDDEGEEYSDDVEDTDGDSDGESGESGE